MDRLLIGFDGKRALNNNTGLGNYSRLVLDVLGSCASQTDMRLYVPRPGSNPRLTPLLERYAGRLRLVTPDTALGRRLSSLWRVYGMAGQLRRDGIQLFHGLSNELPLDIAGAGIPSVVTIHDVIFRRLPRCYKPVDRAIYDYKFRRAAINATRVIAISERTRDDIVEFYGIDPAKIDIVYQGCHEQFAEPVSAGKLDEVLSRYGLSGRCYIIGVGTVEERKNQLLTVKALRGLPDDVCAVIVGRDTRYSRVIADYVAANGLENRVVRLTNVPFGDLPALYAGAALASYPSRYEGFGIPVIEALAAGTPVIVATGSCLEEAGGPDTPAVAPDDVDAFIDVARDILDHPAVAERIVSRGREYIKRFDPQNFADGLLGSYSKVLAEFKY